MSIFLVVLRSCIVTIVVAGWILMPRCLPDNKSIAAIGGIIISNGIMQCGYGKNTDPVYILLLFLQRGYGMIQAG